MRACARLAWGPSDRAASGNDVKSPTNDRVRVQMCGRRAGNCVHFSVYFSVKMKSMTVS